MSPSPSSLSATPPTAALPLDAPRMKSDAAAEIPLSDAEISSVLDGLRRASAGAPPSDPALDWPRLETLLRTRAHLSHKDWDRTGAAADDLASLLFGPGEGDERAFRRIFRRVEEEGRWDDAAAAAAGRSPDERPWAVLVTGVNGIRKTTSIYADWFRDLLAEAVVAPAGEEAPGRDGLPTGETSFFRQLDHMIAALAAGDFERLYATHEDESDPETVASYAAAKDGIFTRYRTLSEILGVALLRRAVGKNMNVMVETSGRDVAMFRYVDKFFPADTYRKMVLHFTVDDLQHAERSVETRMAGEMEAGRRAIAGDGGVHEVIGANAGGPYGPAVLRSVQEQSDKVWTQIATGSPEAEGAGKGWYVACIQIEGNEDAGKWRAAPLCDGKPGKWRDFGQKK